MVLKRANRLLAVTVSLRVAHGQAVVDLRLESFGDAAPPELESLVVPADDLSHSRGGKAAMRLAAVAKSLAAALPQCDAEDGRPLWLHLVKPYGWLGELPWEANLERAFGRATLRLPDFIERPREDVSSLDVAVCCDLPGEEASTKIEKAVRAALRGSPRSRVTVHVFATESAVGGLRDAFGEDPRVWIAPPPAAVHGERRGGGAWLAVMTDTLRDRSVDVVHFICGSALSGDRAVLTLHDPVGMGMTCASPGEVGSVLTRLGAWSAIVTPAGPGDVLASRRFADALAQARAGAVTFDAGDRLETIYSFLFAPEPSTPPMLCSSFLYCQPAFVGARTGTALTAELRALNKNARLFVGETKGTAQDPSSDLPNRPDGRAPGLVHEAGSNAGVIAAPWTAGATPTWLAAAQRYAEQVSMSAIRLRSQDPMLGDLVRTIAEDKPLPSHSNEERMRASRQVEETLEQLQDIVALFAAATTERV